MLDERISAGLEFLADISPALEGPPPEGADEPEEAAAAAAAAAGDI